MENLIYTLSLYEITGVKLVLIMILGIIILLVIFGLLLSLVISLLKKVVRKEHDLVIIQVTVPKFTSGDSEDGDQPKTQQELAEKIALGEAFFNSIANLTSQKGFMAWLFGRTDYYSFEIVLKDGLIYFYAVCPREMQSYVQEQITAQYSDAHIVTVDDYNIFPTKGSIVGAELKFKKEYIYPIKTYRQLESDPLSAITTALSKLPQGSGAAVQFLTRSANPKWHDWGHEAASEANQGKKLTKAIKEAKKGSGLVSTNLVGSFFGLIGSGLSTMWNQITGSSLKEDGSEKKPDTYTLTQKEQEVIKGIEEKASKGGLEVNIRLVVSASNENSAKMGLDGLVNTFFQFNIYEFGNAFTKTTPKKEKLLKNFIFREFNEKNVVILNSEESASIFHFPLGYLETPNIVWLLSKKAPPPLDLPKSGLLLGYNDYRGVRTPIYIKEADRRRHVYVIGMTGTGKSKFLDTMAIRDIQEGRGVCFIDPHGDDVDLILSCVPKERAEDVIYFDPSDVERPFGLNMLEYDFNKPEDKIFVVNQVFQIFDKLYDLKATGGPMFEQYMKNACMLIMDDPESGSTMMEIPRVLADEEFRNYKLSKCRTQVVKDFWEKEATKAGGEASLQNMVPYITSKLTPFIANDLIRPIISQQKTTLDFVDAMNNKKIILVKLAKGKIGDINANLMGMIVIGKILQAAFTRVDMPEEERKDFFLYIDEFQNFLTDSINTILSEARKYRLCLNMAHQFIGQLVVNGDEKIKDAIFGNVGTKIAFRIGVDDSEVMEKEYSPVFSAYDVMNIPKFNCIIKLLVDNANPPPFNMAIPYVEAEFPPN